MDSWGVEDIRQGSGWRMGQAGWWLADQAVPHLHVDKPGGTTGEQDRPHNPRFKWENKASKPACKNLWGCSSGRNSQPHRRVQWRDPQGPRMYTNPPTQESAKEGPNFLVSSRGSD